MAQFLSDKRNVAPICSFLHALWYQCDLNLNGSLISQFSNAYSYRTYIKTLLSFENEAKKSQLTSLYGTKVPQESSTPSRILIKNSKNEKDLQREVRR